MPAARSAQDLKRVDSSKADPAKASSFFSKVGSMFAVSKPKAQSADELSSTRKFKKKQLKVEQEGAAEEKSALNVMATFQEKIPTDAYNGERWRAIAEALPMKKGENDSRKREALWAEWDPEENGFLSLYEIDQGIKYTTGLQPLRKCKPAMMKAFNACKGLRPGRKGSWEDDVVAKSDFRMWLLYLKLFYGLHNRLEIQGSGRERRFGQFEFREFAQSLREWYCPVAPNADDTFEEVDHSGEGEILFEELCLWAMEHAPPLLDDDERNRKYVKQAREAHAKARASQHETPSAVRRASSASTREDPGLLFYDDGQQFDIDQRWKQVGEALPVSKSEEDMRRRKELFTEWDANEDGALSLAEIDLGIRETEGLQDLRRCMPALVRAYNAVKGLSPSRQGSMTNDTVGKAEFRLLLVYLKLFYGLYNRFMIIDTNEDKEIDEAEWKAAAPTLRDWYCPIDARDIFETFDEIDSDRNGKLSFDEFCVWAARNTTLISDEERRAVSTSELDKRANQDGEPKRRGAAWGERKQPPPQFEQPKMVFGNKVEPEEDELRRKAPVKPAVPKFGRSKSEAPARKGDGEVDLNASLTRTRAKKMDFNSSLSKTQGKGFMNAAMRAKLRAHEEALARGANAALQAHHDALHPEEHAPAARKAKLGSPRGKPAGSPRGKQAGGGGGRVSPVEKKGKAEKAKAPKLPKQFQNEQWKALAEKLPVGKTEEEEAERDSMFHEWDVNGNGVLSLAEVERAIEKAEGLEDFGQCKPALQLAYTAAKGLKFSRKGNAENDTVTRAEFRMLLVFLKLYFGLCIVFKAIDTDNNREIDQDEFRSAAPSLRDWFCPIAEDPDATFGEIDADKSGGIDLHEFCEWAEKKTTIIPRSQVVAERIEATMERRKQHAAGASAKREAPPVRMPALAAAREVGTPPMIEGPNLAIPDEVKALNTSLRAISKRDLYVGRVITPTKLKARADEEL